MPDTLEIIILLFIFAAEILGEIQAYYVHFPYWDTMLHTLNGFLCAAIGFSLLDILNRRGSLAFQLSPLYLALVAFCFSMTIGVLWEFFECTMDQLFLLDMQKDTVVHSIGSVMLDPSGGNTPTAIQNITDVIVVTADGTQHSLGLGGYLDIGIMTALYQREKTGRGDYVMTSLYGVGGWVSQNCAIGTQYYDPWPRSRWTQSPMGQAYRTKNGKYVQLFVNEYEKRWDAFCEAFGLQDLHDDPRYNTRTAVNDPENCRRIVQRCIDSALLQTGEELLAKLRLGNIPACINGHFCDRYTLPEQIEHNLANGYFVEHTYDGEEASGRTIYVSQFPLYFGSQGVVNNYARCHALDEDREALLKEFS